jgi:uncharacterized membrane-anchored protein
MNDLNQQQSRVLPPDILTVPNLIPDRSPQQNLPFIRLAAPLFLQSLLIFSISAPSMYALATGTTVILKTMPVDPYDLLRGYYQTLNYDISSFDTLRKLPGWQNVSVRQIQHSYMSSVGDDNSYINKNRQVYITLVKTKTASQAWQPVAISKELPTNLSADRIALRGKSSGGRVIYGLETYYMPETRKDEVNQDISQARSWESRRNLLVEAKVDNRGFATPVSLWVGTKKYHF